MKPNSEYKTFFENIIDGINGVITINAEGYIEFINMTASGLFGYHAEDLVGENINVLMHEPFYLSYDPKNKKYSEDNRNNVIGKQKRIKGIKNDQSIFEFSFTLSELKLDGKSFYTGVIQDNSELEKAETALLEAEKRVNAILTTAVDGIITINSRGIVEMINDSACKLFQYNSEEVLGNNINMLMPQPDKSRHDGYLNNYLHTGNKKIIGIGREVYGLKKDGTIFPLKLSVSEVKLKDKIIFMGSIHDLTQQKDYENKLEKYKLQLENRVEERTKDLAEANRKLEETNNNLKRAEQEVRKSLEKEIELNELKSRFVSMASHEFRTPLSTILSSTTLISKYCELGHDEKRDKHLKRIKSNISHLTSILNDFLSLSKLEEGKTELNFSTFDLIEFLSDVLEEMQTVVKPGQVIIHEHIGNESIVSLDKKLLKNIILNFLSNASKYSSDGESISLKTELRDEKIIIIIADKGMGIPKNEQEHLFERFFRAKNAFNIQGTGLGLHIVKKFVDLMGGNIEFQSELEKGTIFTIKLPLNKI